MASRRLPPLRALEAFVRTVRLGSARAAADELGLSPSALSRRIGNLEEFVGKKLFTRARQAMQLTDDGHAYASYTRRKAMEGILLGLPLRLGPRGLPQCPIGSRMGPQRSVYLPDFKCPLRICSPIA